jgi:hypothetical protein
MTEALQKAIDSLKNREMAPSQVRKSLSDLHDTLRNGVCYTKSEDGIIHGNKPINVVITDLQNEAAVYNFANNRDEIRKEIDIKRNIQIHKRSRCT